MYAKIVDNQVVAFPYSLKRLTLDNPNTSFPDSLASASDEVLARFDVVRVQDTPKPDITETQEANHTGNIVKDGDKWVREWAIRDKTPEELERLKNDKKTEIKARRDEAIASGTTVNGVSVATDDLSQQRITGAALAATVDNTTTVKWKLPDDTFVTLDATQIIGIAQAVRAHVQACFNREAELLDALAAGQAYDIDSGWPVGPG